MNIKLIGLLVFSCNTVRDLPEVLLPPVEIKEYRNCSDITKADSILAIAMLLNRECPECSFLEKQYVASCVITGSIEANCSWKEYLFNRGQFWGLQDKRVSYDSRENQDNLLASRYAWENPYPVRFYASSIDTGNHFKLVKSKGFRPQGFYHYYSMNL